jgi:hypothetical protein
LEEKIFWSLNDRTTQELDFEDETNVKCLNVYLDLQIFNLKFVPKSTNKTFITKTKENFIFLPDGLMDIRKYNVENLINF